jgi:hypothetical protein
MPPNCLAIQKYMQQLTPQFLVEEATSLGPSPPLHRPTQPTNAPPCTPQAQTDLTLPSLLYKTTKPLTRHSFHSPVIPLPLPEPRNSSLELCYVGEKTP